MSLIAMAILATSFGPTTETTSGFETVSCFAPAAAGSAPPAPAAGADDASGQCLPCAGAWQDMPDGRQWHYLGYESSAAAICQAETAPETRLPPDPESYPYVITKEDVQEAKAAKLNVIEYLFGDIAATVSRFNRLDPRFARAGRKIRVPVLPEGQTEYTPLPAVYAPALEQPKYILIDLKRQFLGLYECGHLAASFPISSGTSVRGPKKEDYRTPTGDSRVRAKKKDAKSSKYPEPTGGAPMPYAVNFRWYAYWIHGGDLVGHPASHGCIRLLYTDAPKVFEWSKIGTPVRVVSSLD